MAEKINETAVPTVELLKRFEEAKTFRKKYEAEWDSSREYYLGDQWNGIERISWAQSEPVYNKIFEFVEIHRSYLSDNKWGVDVIPSVMPEKLANEAQDAQDAQAQAAFEQNQQLMGVEEDPIQRIFDMVDKMNKLLDFLWMENRMKSKLSEVILYMFMYGTGFLKSTFDANNISDSGIGQIETRVLSPWYIFPDPDATSIHDASFVFEHHPVTFRWIIERYPEKAAEVLAKGLGSNTEYNERRGDTARGAANSEEAKRVDIIEAWYYDSSIKEDTETGGNYELEFPNGRMTLMTSSGVILEDKPNPYSMFPYVRFVEIPRPAEFFGDCTLTRVKSIQDTINQLLRSIIDNGLWLVHGIWVADTTSGITPDSLAGYAPRDVILKNPGTEVRRDSGDQLPGHLFETLRQQEEAFDRIAGVAPVLRGVVPSRQPVQTVEMQREAGEVRTRERQRRVEESLEDLAKLWLDIAGEHWSDKRVIRNRSMLGGFDMFEMSKKDLEEWKFDVHVVPGSTAPTSQSDNLQVAYDLVERGGVQIPPSYFVELSGLPGLYAAMAEELASTDGMGQEPQQVADGGMPPMDAPPIDPGMEMGEPMVDPNMLPPEMLPPTDMGPVPPIDPLAQAGLM